MTFPSTRIFAAVERSTADALELAFENPLQARVHEDVVMFSRLEGVLTRQAFVALDSSQEVVASSAQDAIGVEFGVGFAHKKELGELAAVQISVGRYTGGGRGGGSPRRTDLNAVTRLEFADAAIQGRRLLKTSRLPS